MMDREKILFLDTETLGNLDADETPLVYDFGFKIIDRAGLVYESGSFIIYDTFVLMRQEMKSAYYANKIPQYIENLRAGGSKMIDFIELFMKIRGFIKQYHIKKVAAYNMAFDRGALDNTLRYLTKSKYRYFFPRGIKYCCIWHMATQVLLNRPTYLKMALKEKWYSEKGNVSTNAEKCFAYLTKNSIYQEEHKGLDDVEIEIEIFLACLKQHKKMDWNIKRSCWRIPQENFRKIRQIA
jgi:hypothetical protein